MKGVNVYVKPTFVFTFKEGDVNKIGAVWLVTKLHGFALHELALFTDALQRHLRSNYKKFEIDSDLCIAMDLYTQRHIKYTQIENEEITSDLDTVLKKIKQLQGV